MDVSGFSEGQEICTVEIFQQGVQDHMDKFDAIIISVLMCMFFMYNKLYYEGVDYNFDSVLWKGYVCQCRFSEVS